MSLRWMLTLFAATVVTAVVLPPTGIPLGVPGEWTWNRTDFSGGVSDALLGAATATIVISGYFTLLHFGLRSIERCSVFKTAAWLSGLTLAAIAVLFSLEATTPGEYSTVKHAWVLYDPGASGYFFEAARSEETTSEFLRGYEAKMAEGDVLHIGTHPPGLTLLYRRLLKLTRSSSGLSRFLLATQPVSIATAFTQLERSTGLTPKPLPESDRAALWLAVVLTHFVAAATVIPLFFVVRQDFGPRTAWMTAAFWPLVPALAVFLPKSDALFPLIGMLFLWGWRTALRQRSFVAAVTAGLILFGGMVISLAMLPVAFFAVALTLFETFATDWNDDVASRRIIKRDAILALSAILGFGAAVGLFFWSTGANLLRIWEWNYHNHSAFYAQPAYARTWWKWLPVNLAELVFAVGLPIVLTAGACAIRAVRSDNRFRNRSAAAVWSTPAVVGILWFSGKNMGEAARLWLFLCPWVLWMSAGFWITNSEVDERKVNVLWYAALIAQSIVAVITVMCVQGFHYGV